MAAEKSSKRKVLLWILGVLGAIIVLVLGVELYGWWQWKDALAEAREVDPLVTYQEIVGARPKKETDTKKAGTLLAELEDRMSEIRQLKKEETYKSLWSMGYAESLPPLGHRLEEAYAAKLEEFFQRIQPAMETIDRLGNYEGDIFQIDPSEDAYQEINNAYDHFGALRQACRLKGEQALYQTMKGHTGKATESILIMLRVGRVIEDYPFPLAQYFSIGMDNLAAHSLKNALGLQTFKPKSLRQFEDAFSGINYQQRCYEAFRGERSIVADIQQFRRVKKIIRPQSEAYTNRASWIGYHGWTLADLGQTIGYLNRIMTELKARPINYSRLEEINEQMDELTLYPLTRMTLSPYLSSMAVICRCQGTVNSTRTAMALERYRLSKGQFPDTLDELVPAYLEEIPKDPADGAPLRYTGLLSTVSAKISVMMAAMFTIIP